MKIKIKRKFKSNSNSDFKPKFKFKKKTSEPEDLGGMATCKRFDAFNKLYKAADGFPGQYRVLSEYYEKLWDQRVPDKPHELIRTKIGYELLRQDYKEAGRIPPQKVLQNIDASARFDFEGLTGPMKTWLSIQMNHQKGEVEMAKTKKVKGAKKTASSTAAPATTRGGRAAVSHLYVEVFDTQDKRQWTDDQIADFIEKKVGARPTLKNVASYRFMYNAGTLKGQASVPKTRVKSFRANNGKAAAAPAKKTATKKKKRFVLKKKSTAAKAKKKKKSKK